MPLLFFFCSLNQFLQIYSDVEFIHLLYFDHSYIPLQDQVSSSWQDLVKGKLNNKKI